MLRTTPTIQKLAWLNFFTSFHFYLHVLSLILLRRGLTLVEIATIETVVTATTFIMEIPTGIIADRIGRKWPVVICAALMGIGELLFLTTRGYGFNLLIAVFTGTGFAFRSGATDALAYESLPPAERDSRMSGALATISAYSRAGFFLGPILGGIILAELSEARISLAIALTCAALVIAVLIGLTIREDAKPIAHAGRPSSLQILRSGWREVRADRRMWRIIALTVFTAPFGALLVTTFAAPYLEANRVPPFVIGFALAFGSVLAIGVQLLIPRLAARFGEPRLLPIAILAPAVLYGVAAIVSGPLPTLFAIVAQYAIIDSRGPLLGAMQNRAIGDNQRATVLSLINMLANLYIALGGPILAAIASGSPPAGFIALALMSAGGYLVAQTVR